LPSQGGKDAEAQGIIVSGLVLALAAFGPASALAKAGGSDRPWKSSATATSTLDLVSLTATSMGPVTRRQWPLHHNWQLCGRFDRRHDRDDPPDLRVGRDDQLLAAEVCPRA
jgi:hypothetical protein